MFNIFIFIQFHFFIYIQIITVIFWKNFGDYKVYKATTVRQKGTVKTPVEAWFTSDLPYSFGPLGFGGLPGFIVELKFEEMIYTLNKIEKANVKIKKPKLNNQISYQEYYIMLEKEVADIKKKGYWRRFVFLLLFYGAVL